MTLSVTNWVDGSGARGINGARSLALPVNLILSALARHSCLTQRTSACSPKQPVIADFLSLATYRGILATTQKAELILTLALKEVVCSYS